MNGRGEIHRLKKRLDEAFIRAPDSSTDIELQSDFAKYLCVLVSGFFETAIVELLLAHAEKKCAPDILQFVDKQLTHWTNPNAEKICNLLGGFNADWHRKASQFLVDERKESVNSLVALRHKIVHGESVGTSLSQVKKYYEAIIVVTEFIADIIDPPAGSRVS